MSAGGKSKNIPAIDPSASARLQLPCNRLRMHRLEVIEGPAQHRHKPLRDPSMSCPRCSGLLVIGAFFLGALLPARAEEFPLGLDLYPRSEHRSHNLDNLPVVADPEQAFRDRLLLSAKLRENQELIKTLLGNEKLINDLKKHFQDQLGRDFARDDELKKKLQEMSSSNPGLLNDSLKGLLKASNSGQSDPSELVQKLLGKLNLKATQNGITPMGQGVVQPQIDGKGTSPKGGPPGHSMTNPSNPSNAPPPAADGFKDFLTRQLNGLADGMQKLDYADDSGALREAIRQFSRVGFGDAKLNLDRLDPGQVDALARMAKLLSPENLKSMKWDAFSRPSWLPPMPSLPKVYVPTIHAPNWSGMPSAPSVSVPSSGSTTGLLWLLVLALLGVLAWKSGSWLRSEKDDDKDAAWQLGSWPIAPARVTTRGDLVRAFEYLALLLLGPTARACHHHDLANRMGEHGPVAVPERREAAERLAELYEQARYAPEQARDEMPLPPRDQAVARQALCLLAGVTPA